MHSIPTVRGRITPYVVLGVLALLTSGVAWLGNTQAHTSAKKGTRWATILASTSSAGAMTFSSTVTGGGVDERTRGLVDFQAGDEIATTVSRTPHFTQKFDLIVVDGVAYQRLDSSRFDSRWERVTGVQAILPFAPLVGSAAPAPALPSVRLVRLVAPPGSPRGMTEYQVRDVTISCPFPRSGQPRFDHSTSWAWVDANGRIRKFEVASVELFSPSVHFNLNNTNFTQITTLGGFGMPISVSTPRNVFTTATPNTPPKQQNPFAGCNVYRGNGVPDA